MGNILTICKKELNVYFRSPIAYVVMTAFSAIAGLFFFYGTLGFLTTSQQRAQMGQSAPMNVNEWVIAPLLSNLVVIFLLLIPLITMRLIAEERRSGTIELLVTSPMSDWEIIVGKWLASLLLFATLLGLSALNIVSLFAYGTPDWRPILVAYFGLLLQGGFMLSIGLFISSLTRNQIVASVITFCTLLALFTLDWSTSFSDSAFTKVLGYVSFITHYEAFSRGVIDSKNVIYFVSMIFLGLFLTARSMDSRRWRA